MPMIVEPMSYGPWNRAFRCTHDGVQLVAVADVGPRVLSFGFEDGPNVLYEDREGRFRRKDWRLYGGHRFWVGPETENAFHPENDPCTADVEGQALRLTAPADPMGLRRRLEIEVVSDGPGFVLRHVVENVGGLLFHGAIWTLTCALPHPVVVPWGAGSERWQCNMVRYWTRWEDHRTDPAGPQWHPTRDYFLLTPVQDDDEGKVGLYTERDFLVLLRRDCTFVKMHTPIPCATYPDGGCNVELYTRPEFVELETLGPLTTFHPGNTYVHEERWTLLRETYRPEQWPAIADRLRP